MVEYIARCLAGIEIVDVDNRTAEEIADLIMKGFKTDVAAIYIKSVIREILLKNQYKIVEKKDIKLEVFKRN